MNTGLFNNYLNYKHAVYASGVLMILVLLLWKLGSNSNPPIANPEQSAESKNTSLGSGRKSREFRLSESSPEVENDRKFEDEAAQIRLENARESAQKLLAKYESASSQLDELRSSISEVLSNQSGSKIASSIESTKRFLAYQSLVLSLEEQFEKLETEKANLEGLVQIDEGKSSSKTKATEIASELEKIKPMLTEFSKVLESRKKGLAVIVRDASRFEESKKSLQDRLNELADAKALQELESAEKLQEKLKDERERQQKEEDDRRIANEIEAGKTKAAAMQAKANAEEKAKTLQAEVERKNIALKAELKRDLPKVEHYLGTLFIKSTSQPSSRGMVETREAMPVSLTGLKEFGYSNPDIEKACSSLLLFFSAYKSAGRGTGPYPAYLGAALNPTEIGAIRPAYDFLEKYGLLLVEEGKLSK